MRFTYCGKKNKTDDFGNVIKTFPPCAEIDYKAAEADSVTAMLEESGRHYDLFATEESSYFAQVEVSDKADYEDFAQDCKEILYRIKHSVGDKVFIIVKDSNFRPTVKVGVIMQMTKDEIRISEPNRYRGIAHNEWTFPWTALRHEIFDNKQTACNALERIEGKRGR